MRGFIATAVLGCIALSQAQRRSSSRFPTSKIETVVIFGNSLSDDGSDAFSGDLHGFQKYANGPIWTDFIVKRISPERILQVKNYAYSGAKSGNGNYYFNGWSGILWQIEKYFEDIGWGRVPDNTLIFMELGGANDLYDGNNVIEEVIQNGVSAVRRLTDAGGRVVVIDMMDFTSAPTFRTEEMRPMIPIIQEVVLMANQRIRSELEDLSLLGPDSLATWVNTSSVMGQVKDRFRVLDVPFSYTRNSTQPLEHLDYAWFDEYHPSSGVHKILADVVYEGWMNGKNGTLERNEPKSGEDEVDNLISTVIDGLKFLMKKFL